MPVEALSPINFTSAGSAVCAPALERLVLILDDDQDFLDTYSRILARLPSRPCVRVANCATRALAMLEGEPFTLLIADLRIPRIDGFQVLLTARRRFPRLKTVAITGLGDQQYRARAYASGIDLYTEKPTTPTEIRLFSECIEAILNQDTHEAGFRGIQSKSLLDLVQIECFSQNSSVLRITRGSLEGRIWIHNGSVIDAEIQGLRGEEAFKQIFAWRTGNFELLPGEPDHPRTIYLSYESLLLDSAQALDESAAGTLPDDAATAGIPRVLQPLARVRGVESLILISSPGNFESWAVDNPAEAAGWAHRLLRDFRSLGQMLNAGPLRSVEAIGSDQGAILLAEEGHELLAGLDRKLTPRMVRAAGKELATLLTTE